MRRIALAGLGLIALGATTPAYAADIRLPVKAAPPAYVHANYNWTGFYLGGHVGYAWADFSGADRLTGLVTASATATGMMYGGTVGFNYQLGSWVLGVEGEFTFGDVTWSENFFGLATAHIKLDHIYTAAGRIGYAFDRTLIYGKFGGAWTQEKYNFAVLGATATGSVDRTWWVVGFQNKLLVGHEGGHVTILLLLPQQHVQKTRVGAHRTSFASRSSVADQ